jgi:hypothetical protein
MSAAAVAHDLPPGVLPFSSVKNHVRGELERLTNVSCLEVVQPEYQPPKGTMRPLDTIRSGSAENVVGGREIALGNRIRCGHDLASARYLINALAYCGNRRSRNAETCCAAGGSRLESTATT